MPVTLDAEPKSPTANSYRTLADAAAYFDTHPLAATWTGAASDDVRARALIMATRDLDTVEWDAFKTGFPTSATQALQFPRGSTLLRAYVGSASALTVDPTLAGSTVYDPDIIPPWLGDACCEQALAHIAGNRVSDSDSRGVRAVKAGALGLEFDSAMTATRKRLCDSAWRVIRPWAVASGDVTGTGMRPVDLVRV